MVSVVIQSGPIFTLQTLLIDSLGISLVAWGVLGIVEYFSGLSILPPVRGHVAWYFGWVIVTAATRWVLLEMVELPAGII